MRFQLSFLFSAAVAISAAVIAPQAHAECTRLGFEVNDYGKEGPTKDAQDLLDKFIIKWAAERGIAKYTVGPKTVTCELFLDFIVFDEHTCTAVANVCTEGTTLSETATRTTSSMKLSEKVAPKNANGKARAKARKGKAEPSSTARSKTVDQITTGAISAR
jgi:hypothetical protein